jgi:hypothetical protein
VSAFFGAEKAGLRPDLHYLSLHLPDLLHVLVHLLLAFFYYLILLFQSFQQILSEYLEFEFLFGLNDFKNK